MSGSSRPPISGSRRGSDGKNSIPSKKRKQSQTEDERRKELDEAKRRLMAELRNLVSLQEGLDSLSSEEAKETLGEAINLAKKEIAELKEKVASLELKVMESEQAKDEASSVAPSKLCPSNLGHARGGMVIHSLDSGVGRNTLFYSIVCWMVEWEKENGGASVTLEIIKKALLSDINQALSKRLQRAVSGSIPPSSMPNNDSSAQQSEKFPGIDQKFWDELSSSIKQAGQNQKASNENKIKYSGRLSWILNKFTKKCGLPYLFSHQFACGNRGDTVDIATLKEDKYAAVGLAEVKLEKIENTKWQLCGYVSAVFRGQVKPVSVGLVIDVDSITLYGFFWPDQAGNSGKRLLEHALLWKQTFTNLVDSGGLILKLYFACLDFLSDGTWKFPELTFPNSPFCPLVETNLQLVKKRPRVFCGTNTSNEKFLFKLFDYGKARSGDRQPNTEYLLAVYEDPKNVTVLEGPPDCGVCVLQAPWFDGSHQPKRLEHIILLCKKLQKLHNTSTGKKKMKHGDVLRQNIVFGEIDKVPFTELIDFDYSHLDHYPAGWNTEFPERHPECREGGDVEQIHDVYAAIAILCLHFRYKDDGVKKVLLNEFVNPADKPFTKNSHPILKPEWCEKEPQDLEWWIKRNERSIELITAEPFESTLSA